MENQLLVISHSRSAWSTDMIIDQYLNVREVLLPSIDKLPFQIARTSTRECDQTDTSISLTLSDDTVQGRCTCKENPFA